LFDIRNKLLNLIHMKIAFDHESFSKALKTKRVITEDLTIRALAKKLKVSPATLSRCENQGTPDLITYAKVCRWLGVEMNKFITTKK
jgi:hypothetical protein